MHNQSVDAHSVIVVQVRSHFGTCVFLDRFSVSETTMPKKGKTGARAASRAPSDVASDGSQADDIVEEATTVAGSKGRKRPSADQLVTVPVAKRRKGAVSLRPLRCQELGHAGPHGRGWQQHREGGVNRVLAVLQAVRCVLAFEVLMGGIVCEVQQ